MAEAVREAAPRVLSRIEEGAVAALMRISNHSREESRERVMKAVQMLSNLGRKATADEIFSTAFYGKVFESGGTVRRCGNGGAEAARQQNGVSKTPPTHEKHDPGDLE